jgi:hypothetical protein
LLNFIEQEAAVRPNPLYGRPGQPAMLGCADCDKSKWRLTTACADDMPGQVDGFNGGVYVIMLMDLISAELPLLFDATDIDLCRKKIALHIIDLMDADMDGHNDYADVDNADCDD